MSAIVFSLGMTVVLVGLGDLVWTTLTLRGGGPLTRTISGGLWKLMRFFHGRKGGFHRGLAHCGWLSLVLTLTTWILLTWGGWALVFGSDPTAVINQNTRQPADLAALLYFSGFAVYTLGVGDYVPNGGLWQVLTPVATINGFVLVTLSVTYIIQIISAAVGDRTVARFIYSLGETPNRILQNAWNGRDFSSLTSPVSQVVQMLAEHSQEHQAYPILLYFHQPDRRSALPLRMAILGEALARAELLQAEGHRVDPLAMGGLFVTIDAVWESLPTRTKVEPEHPPPSPARVNLPRFGLPPPGEEEMTQRMKNLAEKRRRLAALALSDGWEWRDVSGEAE